MTKAHLLALAVIASTPTLALALDIEGLWTCTSKCLCGDHPGHPGGTTLVVQFVVQTAQNAFTFIDECGNPAQGRLDTATGRIIIPTMNTDVIPSRDEKTLTFGNGTIWTKQ